MTISTDIAAAPTHPIHSSVIPQRHAGSKTRRRGPHTSCLISFLVFSSAICAALAALALTFFLFFWEGWGFDQQ